MLQDFANGYAFGELLHKCGLQRNFKYIANSAAPQTMIDNYARLQPTFLELGIQFDSRTANKLIREEKGVAPRLLYSLRQVIRAMNTNMQITMERDELRVELSIASRRQQRFEDKNRLARIEVSEGIHTFEDTIQRMSGKPTKSKDASDPLKATQKYMSSLTANRCQSEALRKEREARRQRVLLEQEQAAIEGEKKSRKTAFVDTLNRSSVEEQEVSKRLWQIQREAHVMTENRKLREAQYAKRRQEDWEECIRREKEKWRIIKEHYEDTVRVENEARRARESLVAEKERKKLGDVCREMAWQITKISELAADYRETMDALVPRKEYRQWMALFVANDPSLNIARLSGREYPFDAQAVIDEAAIIDYMECQGEWESNTTIGRNHFLGDMVARLLSVSSFNQVETQSADIDLRLKLAIIGPPFAGSTAVASALAEEFNLSVIEAEKVAAQRAKENNQTDPLQTKLESGDSLEDSDITSVLVAAMSEAQNKGVPEEESGDKEATPIQGVILDGFPCSRAQAMLFEKQLTGVDVDAEKEMIADVSRLAPPPPQYLPDPDRELISGLDAVIVLKVEDEDILPKRALGRRIEEETQQMQHLDNENPDTKENPGEAESLQEVFDPANAAIQVQSRLATYSSKSQDLSDWLHRFRLLVHHVDGSLPLEEVCKQAKEHVQSLVVAKDAADKTAANSLAAQKAAESAKSARESAEVAMQAARTTARELIMTKKAQLLSAQELGAGDEADPILAEEVLKECTEKFKAGQGFAKEAAEAAQRAVESSEEATKAMNDIESLSSESAVCAETKDRIEQLVSTLMQSSTQAQEEASQAQAASQNALDVITRAKDTAETMDTENMEEAVATFSQQEEEEAQQPRSNDPVKLTPDQWERETVIALHKKWKVVESSYFEGLSLLFSNLREERSNCLEHYISLRRSFTAFVDRSDERNSQLVTFQGEYNAIETDLRENESVKAEWSLRSDELVCDMWDICDSKKEESTTEMERLTNSEFLTENSAIFESLFIEALQLELDRSVRGELAATDCQILFTEPSLTTFQFCRFLDTLLFMSAYARTTYKLPPPQNFPFGRPDLLSDEIPEGLGSALDPKSGLPVPSWLAETEQKLPRMFRACRLALAARDAAVDTVAPKDASDAPPPKGKKDKKDKKDKAPEVSEEELTEEQKEALKMANKFVEECVQTESDLQELRLKQLVDRALVHTNELGEFHKSAREHCETCIEKRYNAECSSTSALAKIIKAAIASGDKLSHELQFEGEDLVVDDGVEVVERGETHSAAAAAPDKRSWSGTLTDEQLDALTASFSSLSPSGYMKVSEIADIIAEKSMEAGDCGWTELDFRNLREALRSFDVDQTGYADWREVIVTLLAIEHSELSNVSADVLAAAAQELCRCAEGTGSLTKDAWMSSHLWFDKKCGHQSSMRNILWNIFVKSDNTMDPMTALLFLCADRNDAEGVRKAFAVISRSTDRHVRIKPADVLVMVYPQGRELTEDIGLETFSDGQIEEMIKQVNGDDSDASEVSFEELMNREATASVARMLISRYLAKDAFVQARKTPTVRD
ncbi:hypothetical protein BSKO_03631 [Bryopsis sp. KO-2023]|nr:hypothetical protein BSKO_03631 [Bryopsis sp. KO-2023]